MDNKHMKKSPTSLIIIEMEIKTKMRLFNQKDIIKSFIEYVEKLKPSYSTGRNAKWYSHYGKQGSFLKS